jgi:energy-converting hydrogenase Eha subunit H
VSVLPILLLGLAGMLVGGVVTLVRQGATKFSIGLVALLAALALAGGIAWLIPGEGS